MVLPPAGEARSSRCPHRSILVDPLGIDFPLRWAVIYTDWFSILTGFPVTCQSHWGRGVLLLKILVCIKQVPQKDAPLKLNEGGTWIREDVSYEVNEPDAFALEGAVRPKE